MRLRPCRAPVLDMADLNAGLGEGAALSAALAANVNIGAGPKVAQEGHAQGAGAAEGRSPVQAACDITLLPRPALRPAGWEGTLGVQG